MTLQELNKELELSLKNYIMVNGYVRSGRLLNSISFNCTYNTELNIKFNSLDYIKYLDNGNLLKDWLKTVKPLYIKFVKTKLQEKIKTELN